MPKTAGEKGQAKEMAWDTVIFDLDGTLLNTLGDLQGAVNYALACYGYPEKTREEVRAFVGNGVGRLMERVIPGGLKNPDYEPCLEQFRRYYSGHLSVQTTPYPGIPELLQRLKASGYRSGIVSNKYDAAVKQLRETYFPDSITVAIGASADVRKKPDPECVYRAMEELGCTGEQTVYVGDSDVDVNTAHNAGLPCIGAAWGFRGEPALKQAGADWVIRHPLELLSILEGQTDIRG